MAAAVISEQQSTQPAAAEEVIPVGRRSRLRSIVVLMRPRQWVKNVLVFAAPGAAGVLDDPTHLGEACVAFVAFCLAASGTYLLNDARDVMADRAHPVKRLRPVAAGDVPVSLARVIGVLLALAGIAFGLVLGDLDLVLVTAAYVALSVAYTHGLKHVAVVDLVAVASGFVLRTVAGAAATDVPISDWFFIVASFGSLFMVAGKRHAEQLDLGDDARTIRSTLGVYSTTYLHYIRSVSSGTVLVAYCLWAFEKADLAGGGFPWFQLSIAPFVVGILRYALLLDSGAGSAPEDIVLGDRALQLAGLAWVVVFGCGVYLL
jgi:decaprenyl-phosphate phosphoribosyltransferase